MSGRRIRKLIYDLKRQDSRIGRALFHSALAVYRFADSAFLRRSSRPDLVSEKLVFRDARVLFVGVPKVATRSLISALTHGTGPLGSPEIHELDIETLMRSHAELRDFFKFTFVRNPWSRATSCYRDKVLTDDPIKYARHVHQRPGLEPGMPFEAFAEWLNSAAGADDVADRHWMSQHRILGTERTDIIRYDFIGRFERLSDDYEEIGRIIGRSMPELPHKLKTQTHNQYKRLYNDRTVELIGKRYARDIELFGYEFDDA